MAIVRHMRSTSSVFLAQQMEFSSGHSFMNSASDDRNLMILAHESQGPMRQTMPRNSGYTMLSSWKGMCTERFSISVTQ